MYKKRKERLYICDIIENPPIIYPMYYTVSDTLKNNEMLIESLKTVHLSEFHNLKIPSDAREIFEAIRLGAFPIYKGQYVVGEFGGRLMYLESSGWKSLQVTKSVFDLNQWLV